MKTKQLIMSLAEQLHSLPLAPQDFPGELGLLFAWKDLSDNETQANIPNPSDVLKGNMSFSEAYSILGENIEAFEHSELPKMLSDKSAKELITQMNDYADINKYELISEIYAWSASELGKFGNIVLPVEVVNLMVELLQLKESEVYSPFQGAIQLAVKAKSLEANVTFEGNSHDLLSQAIVLMTNLNHHLSDPLLSPSVLDNNKLKQFERLTMVHNFGQRIKNISDRYNRFSSDNSNGDILAIEHALAQCSGRMVVLVPQGVLFRSANDYDLRVKLINQGWLDAVIQLPSPILSSTGIATAILVIDKQRYSNSPIVFYDADQEKLIQSGGRGRPWILSGWEDIAGEVLSKNQPPFSINVSTETIKENKYDLSVRKYVLGKASRGMQQLENTLKLSDVADLIRAQLLKVDTPPQGDVFYEVGVKDIDSDGLINKPEKNLQLAGRMRDRAENQRLQPGDILLVTKGSVGKIGLVGKECGKNWVAGQSFQVVRLKHDKLIADPKYLFRYLCSPLVQAYFSEQITGTTIPVIKTADLKTLPVPIMEKTEQEAVLQVHNEIMDSFEKIHEITKQIETLKHSYWSL